MPLKVLSFVLHAVIPIVTKIEDLIKDSNDEIRHKHYERNLF